MIQNGMFANDDDDDEKLGATSRFLIKNVIFFKMI
jgi:hypothetical protein